MHLSDYDQKNVRVMTVNGEKITGLARFEESGLLKKRAGLKKDGLKVGENERQNDLRVSTRTFSVF